MSPSLAKPVAVSGRDPRHLKHKRRYCRMQGCERIVKSQGVCQRHGAKPRLCKVEGCGKQAQGNFDRMCKSHFKAMKRITTPIPKVNASAPPPAPEGSSVYDSVLPFSISYIPSTETVNPLVAHLKAGFDGLKPPAWHRNEERRARGLLPIDNTAAQLEGWERELVWMEILVLTGAPRASFRHLARAWGRDKGFHMVLAQFICERQGDVRRKQRQQAMKPKASIKKQQRPKGKSKVSMSSEISDDFGDDDNAFADDIFNFTVEEFEVITSKWNDTFTEVSSGSSSIGAPPESSSSSSNAFVQQQPQQQQQNLNHPYSTEQQQLMGDQLHLIPPNPTPDDSKRSASQ
ncbi:unnamed protein product [Cylindrotheca closterium]|uniref:Uncharacterized protein n=1 Tax=Cylindrotheca closterium TaxID=2856 RepID=A0AAD2G6K9_9STRA|nr:unnamed protein product [Cylindrotheca closterium]CAJ1964925.1 unnamed protein product [Cylindrotheca closterium]